MSANDLPTSFTYTGQREAEEIGLMYYVARWYDSEIGHFIQADTIVPGAGNALAWNRYGYNIYNPLRFIDPSGHWYIEGWDENYLQRQKGNTCAVVSVAVALSILYGEKLTQEDVQPLFPSTYVGVGVVPPLQGIVMDFDPEIEASYASNGTREDLMNNLEHGTPTLITLAFHNEGVGHVLVVIGYDPETEEFILFDPAYGDHQQETKILNRWGFDSAITSFDALWARENIFIETEAMVSIKRVSPEINFQRDQFISPFSLGGQPLLEHWLMR